jgi:hypothetical protein
MVDDVFRSYRNHNTVAREGSETSRGRIGDLLAELARLTGQGDPYRDGGREDGSFEAREDNTSTKRHQPGEDHYIALRRRQPSPLPQQKKPPSNRHFSRPAVKFNGFPREVSDHPAAVLQYSDTGQQTSPGRDDRRRVLPRPRAPTFLPTVSDDRQDGEMQSAEPHDTHGADSFYDAVPSPRRRLLMVIAVLGLAWLGVASAFSYFAVFEGGALLPTLPPLMAADNGAKKIVPNYVDTRTSNSSQTSTVSAGSSEKFVSRWPADNQESPKTALVSSDPSTVRLAVPIAHAASAPPPAVPPPVTAPFVPASEPKKVHTIIIRSDGSERTDPSAAAHSATSARAPSTR